MAVSDQFPQKSKRDILCPFAGEAHATKELLTFVWRRE